MAAIQSRPSGQASGAVFRRDPACAAESLRHVPPL